MRFYDIQISDASGKTSNRWTSFLNNQSLPSAQNVELTVPSSVFDLPLGAAYVRIWGPSLEEIGQANDLTGKNIKIFAGMQKGLPLAKPSQNGLILQGLVFQSFANWVGTAMTLDLVVQGATGTPADPKNIIHRWPKGTKLSDAITSALTAAFPGYSVNIQISPNLVLGEDETGYMGSIEEYAAQLIGTSKGIIGGNYQGVRITLRDKTFFVFDGTTTQSSPTQVAFEDMIGQPTWVEPFTIQFKCTLRADIAVGDYVKMPRTGFITSPGGAAPVGSPVRNTSIFQGTFQVTQMLHFGNFRQPDGASSWNTTFNAVATGVS